MIQPASLYNLFQKNGVRFYTGVPDSLLRSFLTYVQEQATRNEHIITANEGLAIGLAAGHYFSTGSIPLVYLQNSGLGNTVNGKDNKAHAGSNGNPGI
jgi:phosphonopyruvate decarboxylase